MKIRYFTLPNILTLCNLLSGSFAVICAVASIFEPDTVLGTKMLSIPTICILLSALFDFLDGLSARLTGQYSPLGVQLDSLADMVSFGLAPSLTLLALYNNLGGEGWWWIICLAVALCSALRLARFNIDEEQKEEFIGLPTPALAIAVGSLAWATPAWLTPSIILAIALVGAWLLISPLRMFSLKFNGLSLRNGVNRVRYTFLLVSLAILIIGGLGSAWLVIILYIIVSVAQQIASACHKNRTKTEA